MREQVTGAELARRLGITRQAVCRLAQQGMPRTFARGRPLYDVAACRKWRGENVIGRAGGLRSGAGRPSGSGRARRRPTREQRDRHRAAIRSKVEADTLLTERRIELLDIEIGERVGALVPIEDVRASLLATFTSAKSYMVRSRRAVAANICNRNGIPQDRLGDVLSILEEYDNEFCQWMRSGRVLEPPAGAQATESDEEAA